MKFTTVETPFQQGKTAFLGNAKRDGNPYHPHQDGDAWAKWEAGNNYGVVATVIQPESNTYAHEVYSELFVLARSFEERQYFSAAEALRLMAVRGPEQHKGLDNFSTPDVLLVDSERLAELVRIGARSNSVVISARPTRF